MDATKLTWQAAVLAVYLLGIAHGTSAVARNCVTEPEAKSSALKISLYLYGAALLVACGSGVIIYLKTGAFYSWNP